MDFLRKNSRFEFLYDGKKAEDCDVAVSSKEEGNVLTTVYEFSDGLKVTNIAKYYEKFGAYEWVNYFENTKETPTKIISELYDCSVTLPLLHEEPRKWESYFPDEKKATKIYAPSGSTWTKDEFYCDADKICNNRRINHIYPGEIKEYATTGGRSSESNAPFFDIHKENEGILFAIGWTGQWNCKISRGEDDVVIKTKIEDTRFRLLGKEKFRTSSIVIMPYKTDLISAHNRWRRLIKEEFSLIGSEGRDGFGPLCAGIWGGMKTESVLSRIEKIKENSLPFDYIWMDAGWYGDSSPTKNEFEGDWGIHTGNWKVSKKTHPNELKDVSKAIHEAGMKFLLWFEPERVRFNTPIVQEHPEYMLVCNSECGDTNNLLLNLGNNDAWGYCFNMLCDTIENLKIDCYRQDFNFEPLEYWRKNDAGDRQGICEIKYINGLYKLLDSLLEKFPHLLIDNCASGGRRIDIEMSRRSMPLWRSDYQCPANYDIEASQCHHQNYNMWMPYSGTGTGRIYDLYRVRSSYAASLTANYSYAECEEFADTPEKLEFIKKFTEEYLKVRPYFSEDFYPLTEFSTGLDTWCALQFDRPSEKDGIVEVFKRENSSYIAASFRLGGICEEADYEFLDADDNSVFMVSGKELIKNGFSVTIKEKRAAKIYFYKQL